VDDFNPVKLNSLFVQVLVSNYFNIYTLDYVTVSAQLQ